MIDLETLAQPRFVNAGAAPLDLAIEEIIAESPLPVGVLPLWNVLAPRVRAVDLGVLSDRDTLMTPLRMIGSPANESYLTVEAGQHLPSLQGERVRSSDYLAQFVDRIRSHARSHDRLRRFGGCRETQRPARAVHRPQHMAVLPDRPGEHLADAPR